MREREGNGERRRDRERESERRLFVPLTPLGAEPGSVRDAHLFTGSIDDKYPVGTSIRPICTRRCSTMTNMIQVLSNFR